jgi:hypothetical protein
MERDEIRLTRRTLAKGALAVACIISAGMTTSSANARWIANQQLASLSVVDRDSGRVLRTYVHNGRFYVAGHTGARYGLRLSNRTNGRVLLVVSVDGVNVISGETANFNQRGYVLSAHETADIFGWRKNQNEIAAFRFAPLPQSYAARTGRPDDVGVIGMAVFRERYQPPPPVLVEPQYDRQRGYGQPNAAPPPPSPRAEGAARDSASENRAMQMPAPAAKLGTAHGEIEQSYIDTVAFEKATSRPESVQLIEYDSMANLIAAGVIPRQPEYPHHPRPFPNNHDTDGYVPDPPPMRE